MTIVESAAWQGLTIQSVRPYQKVRMLQQLLTIAEDQAFNYEYLHDQAVPGGSGSSVQHIHDGTDGLIIPIPAANAVLGATLPNANGSGTDQWQPLVRQLIRTGGETTWRVWVFTTTPTSLQKTIRVVVWDSSLAVSEIVTELDLVTGFTYGDLQCLYADVTVDATAYNVVSVECWDGLYYPGGVGVVDTRRVETVTMGPYDGDPYPVRQVSPPLVSSNSVGVPSMTLHRASYPFTSFDDSMFDDDMAVSSYLVQRMALNEAVLFERATGQPAGSRSSATFSGHSHEGDTGVVAVTDNVGAEMFQLLGCWNYGVGRRPDAVPAGSHFEDDMNASADDTWSGRIFAPVADPSSTAFGTIGRHWVRLPRAQAATLGASGSLKCAVLVRNNVSKYTGSTASSVRAQMAQDDLATTGTADTATSALGADGLEIIEVSTSLEAAASSAGEEIQALILSIANASTASGPSFGVYSSCLYLDP